MLTIADRIVYCEQGSQDWFNARLCSVTSSRVADVVAKRKKGSEELACRRDMRLELFGEHMTGEASEHYVSRWMEEGKEKEPDARAAYESRYGVMIEQVGYVYHPTIAKAGASPDGFRGDDGIVEFKCPKLTTHLSYLDADVIPDKYLPQLLWQLACEDTRLWIDFASFHPMVKPPYDLFVKRLERTEEVQKVIAWMELEVIQFLAEVEEMAARFKR